MKSKDDPHLYRICIHGVLDADWSEWFAGLTVTHQDEQTFLSGIVDQATLHGILARIRDLNLTLISVNREG